MPRLSRYSEYYRDLDEQQAERALVSVQSQLEYFRLQLDIEYIVPWIKGPDVLDFPIGTGRLYPNFIGRFNVHGYDIAPRYIERAKTLNPEIADRFRLCELERPNANHSFDTVITMRTLARIGDTGAAVRGVASILKPRGRWIFNYPAYEKDYGLLPSALDNCGLRVILRKPYDLHAGNGSGWVTTAIYSRYRALIEAGRISYPVFKLVDTILARRGTLLIVAEKLS